jgi:MoxR-like ATPase
MATIPELDPSQVAELGARLRENVSRAVKAPEQVLRDVLVSFLAEGHVLIEDYPGVGKTALARALARSIDAEYARVQCTADLLPADVVGTNVYNQRENRFEFRPGPVFANVVLVDEVNRASPKTQSGLLECMQERHVTVDRHTHELARPFIVVATQNPVEYEGTYPLPEAQLDRFMVRVSLGYPTAKQESEMLMDHAESDRVLDLEPVADVAGILAAQTAASAVHGSEALRRYVVAISDATRADPRVELGASPRAGLMLFRAAKAYAALDGRDHALPDDVQKLAGAVLTHRLLLAPGTGADERAVVVRDALERVPAL